MQRVPKGRHHHNHSSSKLVGANDNLDASRQPLSAFAAAGGDVGDDYAIAESRAEFAPATANGCRWRRVGRGGTGSTA